MRYLRDYLHTPELVIGKLCILNEQYSGVIRQIDVNYNWMVVDLSRGAQLTGYKLTLTDWLDTAQLDIKTKMIKRTGKL